MKKPIIFTPEEKALLLSKTDSKLVARQEKAAPRSKIDDLAEEIINMLDSEWDHHYPVDCSSFMDRLVREFLANYGVKVISYTYKPTEVYITANHPKKLSTDMVDTCVSILEKIKNQKHKIKPVDLFDPAAPLEIVDTTVPTVPEKEVMYGPIVAPKVKVIVSEDNIVIPEVKVVVTTTNELETEAVKKVEVSSFHPVVLSDTMLFELA